MILESKKSIMTPSRYQVAVRGVLKEVPGQRGRENDNNDKNDKNENKDNKDDENDQYNLLN